MLKSQTLLKKTTFELIKFFCEKRDGLPNVGAWILNAFLLADISLSPSRNGPSWLQVHLTWAHDPIKTQDLVSGQLWKKNRYLDEL